MYEELVKSLREKSWPKCTDPICSKECDQYKGCWSRIVEDAAAAIEALEAEVKRLELDNEDYEHENRRLLDENEALRKNADEYLRDELEELKEQLNDADVAADDNGRQVKELQAEVKDAFNRGYNAGYTAGIGYMSFKREKEPKRGEMAEVVRCKGEDGGAG